MPLCPRAAPSSQALPYQCYHSGAGADVADAVAAAAARGGALVLDDGAQLPPQSCNPYQAVAQQQPANPYQAATLQPQMQPQQQHWEQQIKNANRKSNSN